VQGDPADVRGVVLVAVELGLPGPPVEAVGPVGGEVAEVAQVGALLNDPPDWLIRERESYAAVVAEKERVRSKQTGKGS